MYDTKVAVLKLNGDFEQQGFQVSLEISQEGQRPYVEEIGWLPPAPDIVNLLDQWQDHYRSLGAVTRITPKRIVYGGPVNRLDECRQSAQELCDRISCWLTSPSFRAIDLRLRETLNVEEPVRVLIRSSNRQLSHLPWHTWEFIDRYHQAEVALSPAKASSVAVPKRQPTGKVKILAILGNPGNIDTSRDRQLLDALPHADVTFLVEPECKEVYDQLWNEAWDILFFAGHSQTEGERGRLYINSKDSFTIEKLKYGLRRAVQAGLQLAIFNSCDGLGLAYELESVNLPQLIVMREPVPDEVAQSFLNYFLDAFSKGDSLYLAVRNARERLHGLEKDFPCSSWLPMIYQNPTALPPSWEELYGQPQSPSTNQADPPPQSNSIEQQFKGIQLVTISSIIVASLVVGIRSLGFMQFLELKVFDSLVQLRPREEPDNRLLVITVDEKDLYYQDAQNFQRHGDWSLSDQALAKLLSYLKQNQARVIGLDIHHPYPFDEALADDLSNANMVTTCFVGFSGDPAWDQTPPPGFADDRLGFADFPVDGDGSIRRQLLLMAEGDPCQTSRAFSLQLAHQYLVSEGIEPIKKLSNGERELGGHRLKQVQHDSGGYQLPIAESYGYQILLNYRYADPVIIPLRQVLEGEENSNVANLVKDRIVLIGVNQPQQDRHKTSHNQSTPGVIVHAHMISQILDIVLENKSQLWWWPQWKETIWIVSWSVVGGGLGWLIYRPLGFGVSIFVANSIIYGLCCIAFIHDGWIPMLPAIAGLSGSGIVVAVVIKLTGQY